MQWFMKYKWPHEGPIMAAGNKYLVDKYHNFSSDEMGNARTVVVLGRENTG